jgi:prepilin-type N-terminal cleavage/methylation domain-containing protein
MTDKSNESSKAGFTLIEVIVVGVLMSALVLGAFPVFMMYKDTTRETKMNLKMQRQAEALVDEIARRVRHATFVGQNDSELRDLLPNDNVNLSIPSPVKEIIIDNRIDNTRRLTDLRFTLAGGVLFNDSTFMVGGREVLVDHNQSSFELHSNRKQVSINMVLRAKASNGQEFTLSIQRGAFRCRN